MAKKPDFYGLKIPKDTFVETYAKVKNGSLVEQIKNNPSLAIEVQLFLDHKELISKKAGGKSYNDGIDTMADRLAGKGIKTSTGEQDLSHESDSEEDYISKFVQ